MAAIKLLFDAICSGGYDIACFNAIFMEPDALSILAKEIKKLNPKTIIIAGGPEITKDNALLCSAKIFDYLVFGEGEETLCCLVNSLSQKNNSISRIQEPLFPMNMDICLIPPRNRINPLDQIPNPYVNGMIPLTEHAFMRLKSARGCTRHCTYCFYTHHYKSVKYFSLNYVELR